MTEPKARTWAGTSSMGTWANQPLCVIVPTRGASGRQANPAGLAKDARLAGPR